MSAALLTALATSLIRWDANMSDCKGWFGNRRCKFEPRYDVSAAKDISGDFGEMWDDTFLEMLEKSRSVTYVCDVCVHCGKVVPNDKPDPMGR